MTERDPYAILGVPRTASREEIARAYRRVAKRFHPDAATGEPSASMLRINEAWRTLSDAARRAQWDRAHTVVQPAPWVAAAHGVDVHRRPDARQAESATERDSGWLAVAVVAAAAVVVAGVMAVVGLTSNGPSPAEGPRFTADGLSFENPHEWMIAAGEDGQPLDHRVLAHIVSFGVEPRQQCTSFTDPCELTADVVPPGEASIVITAWEGGTPPVPDPLRRLVSGLSAQRMIGDEPAAFRLRRLADSASAWWQLSPPGFPERWIEVQAEIGGQVIEQDEMMAQIEEMLATVQFGP
jgi:hypothetical protein